METSLNDISIKPSISESSQKIDLLSPEGRQVIKETLNKIKSLDINLNKYREDNEIIETLLKQLESSINPISNDIATKYREALSDAMFEERREQPNGGLKLIVTETHHTADDSLDIPQLDKQKFRGIMDQTDEVETLKVANTGY